MNDWTSDDAKGSAPAAPANPLLDHAILPTLLGLAWPNLIALTTQSIVVIVETFCIGRIGTEALAAMALVFPLIALTQMLSGGAMGGGVSSAISRAIGAADGERARSLAVHAIGIGLAAGLAMTIAFVAAAPDLLALLGGRDLVLELAIAYATTFFLGAVVIWLFNTLMSIVRGTGNMRLPSATLIAVAIAQIMFGLTLGFGLGPFPRLGLMGIAIGQIMAHALGAIFLATQLTGRSARLRLGFSGVSANAGMVGDILKVGAVACLSPVQSILCIVVLTKLAATFGTTPLAGFGIGMRLELLLVPISFSIGVACVPMVGMAIGAGRVDRARRVAWTGACLAGALIGSIGLVLAWNPRLWGVLFSSEPAVLDAVSRYLGIAGFGFPAYGFALCLYFASQGSGKILGPVLGGTVRLAAVLVGGWWLLETKRELDSLAFVILGSLMAYAAATALFVRLTRWGPPPAHTPV